ncbi:MAG: hypothetical protein IJC21_07645 [Lentisphaeria bacterium]|nr:hypothetical protein [Lentisphaeria bacterium]
MSIIAFILIVSSAILHATWNLLAKKSSPSLPFYATASLTATTVWVHALVWTPVKYAELPPTFWRMTLLSVSSDTLYAFGLVRCYRTMEMSQAYPMMRSIPLLLTAIITSICGIGKELTVPAIIGMVTVFCGCLLIPLEKFSDFKLSCYLNRKTLFILLVACGTTGYTIFDSQAQGVMRAALPDVSKPVLSMTYYPLRGLMLAVVLWSSILFSSKGRQELADLIKSRNIYVVIAGLAASGTYIMVLLAMNYVTNVSYVQVFRQIGLVFGVAAGIIILKEKCNLPKIAGVALILAGLVLTII